MSMLLMTLACAPKSTEVPAAAEVPAVTEPAAVLAETEPSSSMQLHMSEHFAKTRVANEAFIHGEVGQAQDALAWLAEHEAPEGLPEGSRPWLAEMKTAATEGSVATHPAETAAAIGRLGAACAGCHAEMRGE
ncbi:MAG: hypothetical protein GY884_24630 [Proteobacteria bacterium]|nr:hypothetical protein [Pseudomonadota bacterium]